MKFTILGSLLILLASGAIAQVDKPRLLDNLFTEKEDLLAKYFPADQNGLKYSAFSMSPDIFLSRLNKFKAAAYQKASAQKSGTLKQLIIDDVNAFSITVVQRYIDNYGIDSAKQAYFYSLIQEENADKKKIDEADRAMYTKKLKPAARTKLERLVNQKLNINNDQLFQRSAFYRRVIDTRIKKLLYKNYEKQLNNGEDEDLFKMDIVHKLISNQFINDYYAYNAMESIINNTKNKADVKSAYDKLLPQIKHPYYLSDLTKRYDNFITFSDGKPAPNFIYKDVNGKEVSLKDLKGKYVYIDIWATWCGPCKAEIPALNKIEEEFEGKNIHFVSISVDKLANYNLWKSYVINNKLKGIQLMVDKDFKSEFIESFNISFIPRFILIDPDGNIEDSNAKRPSDPALIKQLTQLL